MVLFGSLILRSANFPSRVRIQVEAGHLLRAAQPRFRAALFLGTQLVLGLIFACGRVSLHLYTLHVLRIISTLAAARYRDRAVQVSSALRILQEVAQRVRLANIRAAVHYHALLQFLCALPHPAVLNAL